MSLHKAFDIGLIRLLGLGHLKTAVDTAISAC